MLDPSLRLHEAQPEAHSLFQDIEHCLHCVLTDFRRNGHAHLSDLHTHCVVCGTPRIRTVQAVQFDWLGVTARVSVTGATYVTANITTTATVRGTRLKAYMSDQGFNLYPEVRMPHCHHVGVLGVRGV